MKGHPFPLLRDPLQKNDAIFMYGARMPKPFVYAYETDSVCVVHGPSCRIENEICTEECTRDDIPVFRRRTGGGTVVLSPGMVVTVIVGEREGSKAAPWYFDRIHDAMIHLLADTGISPIKRDGISDLSCNGRKILGSSLYLGSTPRLYYYQSSFMISSDITLLSRYLHHPPREPQYRASRSHGEFCTTLSKEGFAITAENVVTLFNDRLSSLLRQDTDTPERNDNDHLATSRP